MTAARPAPVPKGSAAPARTARAASPWIGRLMAALGTLASLAAVLRVHAAGEALLAVTLLALTAFALWTYSSRRTHALRYLFPGVAAAVVFVIFPMVCTVGIGFSNYSASNLLDKGRASAYLQEEAVHKPGATRPFTLHRDADGLRVLLPADDGHVALMSAPVRLDAGAASSPAQTTLLFETAAPQASAALPLRDSVALLPALRALSLRAPGGELYTLASLRSVAVLQPLYRADASGALTDQLTGTIYRADDSTGFYTSAQGDRLTRGYRVGVGLAHYRQIFSEGRIREPFV